MGTRLTQDANAELRLQLIMHRRHYASGGQVAHDATRATLIVRDTVSGLVVAEVYLDAQTLADLLTGSETGTITMAGEDSAGTLLGSPAWLAPPERRADFGRRHFHVSLPIGYSNQHADDISDWIQRVRQATGAAEAGISRRNDRRTYLILRSYLDTDEQGETWSNDAAAIVAEMINCLPQKGSK
jgi:hypothetical protein